MEGRPERTYTENQKKLLIHPNTEITILKTVDLVKTFFVVNFLGSLEMTLLVVLSSPLAEILFMQ